MLELLRVRAFAIIDELEAHFAPGFNVLTGETGAGKSILVDALHLVLGGRAQADAVITGADEAEVQALFRPRDPAATDARLSGLGLPAAGSELVVRRTVQREGRSRAWVNGALATAAQLAQATRGLLDISGQHEHVGLLDAQTHLAMLDGYAGLSRGAYEAAFATSSRSWRRPTPRPARTRRSRRSGGCWPRPRSCAPGRRRRRGCSARAMKRRWLRPRAPASASTSWRGSIRRLRRW